MWKWLGKSLGKCFIGNSFYDIFIVIYIFFHHIEVNALYKHEERSMVAIKDELGDQ